MTNETKNLSSCRQGDCGEPVQRGQSNGWSYLPQIDVIEHEDRFEILCDAPGVDPQNLELTYEKGGLLLHGAIAPRGIENARYLRQEYGVGDFDREIPLGRMADAIDGDRISATYGNGVLEITLPKVQAAKSRRIKIAAN